MYRSEYTSFNVYIFYLVWYNLRTSIYIEQEQEKLHTRKTYTLNHVCRRRYDGRVDCARTQTNK